MPGGFKPPIPLEIREQILKKVKEGMPVPEAAKQHDVSPRTVYDWLANQTNNQSPSTELQRLRRENQELYEMLGRLTVELERWKKKNSHQ